MQGGRDINNRSQFHLDRSTITMVTTKAPASDARQHDETRCECGQLMAKVRGQGLELKCKRCKRIVVIPFTAIEGWTGFSSGHGS
jgi:phage FluMu protein Com